MQTALSKIWTPIAMFISNNNNHYTTNAFLSYFYRCDIILNMMWHNQMGLQNTPTAFLRRGKTLPMSVLDMTLNNLMVRL